jgi:hypothetical protein
MRTDQHSVSRRLPIFRIQPASAAAQMFVDGPCAQEERIGAASCVLIAGKER